jgi:uncharacterized protein YqgV (UPF0045/DUF77 family)
MDCRAEFMIEPFEEGSPGPHVLAGIDAVRSIDLDPDVGPFGTAIRGEPAIVIEALGQMMRAASGAGATRVSIQLDLET